jgi:hypothetical protein
MEDLELVFEPDQFAEEELDDVEDINKALISDATVRKCRFIASVRCVEYGKIGIGAGDATCACICVSSHRIPCQTGGRRGALREMHHYYAPATGNRRPRERSDDQK